MVNIILHCSASNFGNAALIEKWHLQRGWKGIGYHYVILNGWLASGVYNAHFNGHIETGRPLDHDPFIAESEIGAHVKGFNKNSVGVCLIGQSGEFTDEQMNAALKCVHMLEKQYEAINIFQHSDFDTKKPHCAGIDIGQFKKNYDLYKDIVNQAENQL